MFKAFFVDFDNTLAGPSMKISPALHEPMKHVLQQNVFVSIATGRPLAGPVEDTCKELGITNPQIVHGGAEIIEPVTRKLHWAEYIPADELSLMLTYLNEKKIIIALEKGEDIFSTGGQFIPAYGDVYKFRPLEEAPTQDIPKLIIPATEAKLSEEEAIVMEEEMLKQFPDLHIIKMMFDGFYGFDITSLKASKHLAVLEYMKLFDIQKEETIGAGDGYNDFPLLTACGTKVAMANAPQGLRDLADFIAPTQAEDGIVEVIKKYFP